MMMQGSTQVVNLSSHEGYSFFRMMGGAENSKCISYNAFGVCKITVFFRRWLGGIDF